MTKEEFLAGVREICQDAKDPDGQLASVKRDFQELYSGIAPHDAEMATHLNEINVAIDRFVAYASARIEG